MPLSIRRRVSNALLLATLGTWTSVHPAAARPFAISDLLATEGVGRVLVSPSQRWLVFERQGAFAAMPRQDMLMQHEVLRSTPFVVDLSKPGPAQPLAGLGAGTVLYAFSPDGARIAVGRLQGSSWQLGVVTLATRTVRWWKLAPDYTPFANTLEWLSSRRLILITEPNGTWPWWLRDGHPDGSPTRDRWNATRVGGPASVTVAGSGRFLQTTPLHPIKELRDIDVVNGRQTLLASGPFLEIALSPDHQRLAETLAGPIVPASLAEPLSPMTSQWRHRLRLRDLADGHVSEPCPTCDVAGTPQWSSDSRAMAAFARADGAPWSDAKLFRIDAVNGLAETFQTFGIVPTVLGPPLLPPSVRLAWPGKDLLVYGRRVDAPAHPSAWFRVGRAAEPLADAIADQPPLIADTPACRATLVRTADLWCLDSPTPRRMAADLAEIVDDRSPFGSHVVAIDRSGFIVRPDQPTDLSLRVDHGERVDPATAALGPGLALVRHRTASGVSSLDLLGHGGRVRLTTLNAHLADVAPPEMLSLHYPGPDKSTLTSWLLLPANANRERKLPLVVIPYAGRRYDDQFPADQLPDSGTFYTNAQLLAAHGYAVLLPSMPMLRASDAVPLAFADQLDHAVDAALATGRIDPTRLALWGHSYGGYAAALVASETNRYKAVIASAGLYDLSAVAGVLTPASRASPETGLSTLVMYGWLETGQAQIATQPWVDPTRYVVNSPFFRADRIHTPLMLIAADWDIAPVSQAEQMFGALDRQNKDAVLLTYWGEGHVVGSPANVRDLYGRIFAWLATCLDSSGPSVQPIKTAAGGHQDPFPSSRPVLGQN